MIRNFLKIAFRNLRNNKTYSFLNVFGLAVGIACAGLILLWVEDELSFDGNQKKKDQVYLVKVNAQEDAGIYTHSSTPGPLAPAMQATLPGIAATCRMTEGATTAMLQAGGNPVNSAGLYSEASVFRLFTLPFLEGNAATALSRRYSIVLTEKTAKKLFGTRDQVMGRTVRMDNKQDYVVTGILKNMPANSSLQFEWLAPFEVFYDQSDHFHKWNNFGITTYVELKPGADVKKLNAKLLERDYDFTTQKKESSPSSMHVFLFGMKDWHLRDQFADGLPTGGGRIEYVRLFSLIAGIILIIACINFMNLATARSEKRSREVGVRKVLGAGKNALVVQFIGEALLLSLVATICAVIIVSLVLPAFNLLVQKNLSLEIEKPAHWLAALLLALTCGLVAGSYPALYLSSFHPARVLKGLAKKGGAVSLVRRGLVVLQFSTSIVLIIGTIVIYQQIQHVKSRNLGFNRKNLVQIPVQGNMISNFGAIRQELVSSGLVENAALTDHPTLFAGNNTGGISWPGKAPDSKITISQRVVSPEFIQTMGMHLKEGRDFSAGDEKAFQKIFKEKDLASALPVIVTESMEKLLGKGTAIGKLMQFNTNMGTINMVAKGVVADYVYGDMYGQAAPVVFYCSPEFTTFLYVRLKENADPEKALAKTEEVLRGLNPGYPFEFTFVDEQFNNMFLSESLISKLSRVFAAIAILISCLGLFGLAAYTAERRIREIGIRKVLGASVGEITQLLTRDFLQLVLLSCLIAFPLAWWTMHGWLQSYPYRITISGWIFVLAGCMAMLIALATVSFQAIRAAITNPVKSLRTE